MTDENITFEVKEVDERIITIPAVESAVGLEEIGQALRAAGQEGYALISMSSIRRDYGSQRDPDVRTLGVKLRLVRT